MAGNNCGSRGGCIDKVRGAYCAELHSVESRKVGGISSRPGFALAIVCTPVQYSNTLPEMIRSVWSGA